MSSRRFSSRTGVSEAKCTRGTNHAVVVLCRTIKVGSAIADRLDLTEGLVRNRGPYGFRRITHRFRLDSAVGQALA